MSSARNMDCQFNVRLSSEQMEKLRFYAWQQGPGVSPSEAMRRLIDKIKISKSPRPRRVP